MWRSSVQQILDYEGPVYRPPSEADLLILQATVGCSWNHCTYCAMYRHKEYRERPIEALVDEIRVARDHVDQGRLEPVRRVFVGDGDALHMSTERWGRLLEEVKKHLPRVTRISGYATGQNLMKKSVLELSTLRELGLRLLYIGPESGDDETLKAIAKRATFADHAEAARRATEAGMERSRAHEMRLPLQSRCPSRGSSLGIAGVFWLRWRKFAEESAPCVLNGSGGFSCPLG